MCNCHRCQRCRTNIAALFASAMCWWHWSRFKWPHNHIRRALPFTSRHFTPLPAILRTYLATFRLLRDNWRAKMATIQSVRQSHSTFGFLSSVRPHGWWVALRIYIRLLQQLEPSQSRTACWGAICIQMQVTCFYATPRPTCAKSVRHTTYIHTFLRSVTAMGYIFYLRLCAWCIRC